MVGWCGGERLLIKGEPFDRGFFECLAGPGDGVAVVEVVEVAFALARNRGHVEAGLLAGAGEGDIAPLLQPLSADAVDKGTLDGDSLAGVAGEGVGMADVTSLQVV